MQRLRITRAVCWNRPVLVGKRVAFRNGPNQNDEAPDERDQDDENPPSRPIEIVESPDTNGQRWEHKGEGRCKVEDEQPRHGVQNSSSLQNNEAEEEKPPVFGP